MKNIFLFLILVSEFVFSQNFSTKSIDYLYDSDTINKKVKVRLLKIIHIKNQFNYSKLDSLQREKFIDKIILKSFDDFGNLSILEESSFFDGKLSESVNTEYKYDSKNRITSIICPRYENKIIYEYEENSENYNYFEYHYNKTKYDQINKVIIKNGLIVNTKKYDDSGNFIREEIYKYNSNNEPIFKSLYGVKTDYTYIYDSKKRILNKSFKNNFQKSGFYNYKYDSDNRLIEENYYFNNQLESKKINFYNNNRIKKQQINYYLKGKLHNVEVSTFKYDEFDNWIEKETLKNNIPNRLIIRKFNYLK